MYYYFLKGDIQEKCYIVVMDLILAIFPLIILLLQILILILLRNLKNILFMFFLFNVYYFIQNDNIKLHYLTRSRNVHQSYISSILPTFFAFLQSIKIVFNCKPNMVDLLVYFYIFIFRFFVMALEHVFPLLWQRIYFLLF